MCSEDFGGKVFLGVLVATPELTEINPAPERLVLLGTQEAKSVTSR